MYKSLTFEDFSSKTVDLIHLVPVFLLKIQLMMDQQILGNDAKPLQMSLLYQQLPCFALKKSINIHNHNLTDTILNLMMPVQTITACELLSLQAPTFLPLSNFHILYPFEIYFGMVLEMSRTQNTRPKLQRQLCPSVDNFKFEKLHILVSGGFYFLVLLLFTSSSVWWLVGFFSVSTVPQQQIPHPTFCFPYILGKKL